MVQSFKLEAEQTFAGHYLVFTLDPNTVIDAMDDSDLQPPAMRTDKRYMQASEDRSFVVVAASRCPALRFWNLRIADLPSTSTEFQDVSIEFYHYNDTENVTM